MTNCIPLLTFTLLLMCATFTGCTKSSSPPEAQSPPTKTPTLKTSPAKVLANEPTEAKAPKSKAPGCGDLSCQPGELTSCPLDCVEQWTPDMDFVTVWKVDKGGLLTIPTDEGASLYQVDWDNDGVFDQKNLTMPTTHVYDKAGTYTVRIRGKFPHMQSVNDYYCNGNYEPPTTVAYLLEVKQWGSIQWESMKLMFSHQTKLELFPDSPPDLRAVRDMSHMFCHAAGFNQNISGWDTAHVTTMEGMFDGAESFDQNIGGWNTSKVTNMKNMFNKASVFNQDISAWDTSSVENTAGMFGDASLFNQDISTWDTSRVNWMVGMFSGALLFNQKIGVWDTSRVTSLALMFNRAKSFNQDISTWNTSKVTDMMGMFDRARSFNQNIGGWDTSKVEHMGSLFNYARSFNQDISRWDTSNVTTMHIMFKNARSFNQDIGGWDTSKVDEMDKMFLGAKSFNQNVGQWSLHALEADALTSLFKDSGMTTRNYDATLKGWAAQQSIPKNVELSTDLHFCAGAEARGVLVKKHAWVIEDKGKKCP